MAAASTSTSSSSALSSSLTWRSQTVAIPPMHEGKSDRELTNLLLATYFPPELLVVDAVNIYKAERSIDELSLYPCKTTLRINANVLSQLIATWSSKDQMQCRVRCNGGGVGGGGETSCVLVFYIRKSILAKLHLCMEGDDAEEMDKQIDVDNVDAILARNRELGVSYLPSDIMDLRECFERSPPFMRRFVGCFIEDDPMFSLLGGLEFLDFLDNVYATDPAFCKAFDKKHESHVLQMYGFGLK